MIEEKRLEPLHEPATSAQRCALLTLVQVMQDVELRQNPKPNGRQISRRLSSAKLPTPNLDDNLLQSLISGITVFICLADLQIIKILTCRPIHSQFTMLFNAIKKIQVNQTLIWNI